MTTMSYTCPDCDATIAGPDLQRFGDAYIAHVRSAHPDWPYPDVAIRAVAEATQRLTGSTERLPEIGEVTIHPVTDDRLDDWLYFFDHDSHAGNPVAAACYCTEAHVLERGKPLPPHPGWQAHRQLMSDMLRTGRSFGYLAYVDGRAAGWVNASKRADYTLHRKGAAALPADDDVVGIACFVMAPPYRGHGLAPRLLERVVADAPSRGVAWVEAYPRPSAAGPGGGHRGALEMYLAQGFEVVADHGFETVVRRPV